MYITDSFLKFNENFKQFIPIHLKLICNLSALPNLKAFLKANFVIIINCYGINYTLHAKKEKKNLCWLITNL